MSGKSDRIYRRQRNSVAPFAFDQHVAAVFDDMVERSIPGYAETQRMTAELLRWSLSPGDTILDVGSSTGALVEALGPTIQAHQLRLHLIDSSASMVEAAAARVAELGLQDAVDVEHADIVGFAQRATGPELGGLVLNYLVQFLPTDERLPLLRALRAQMRTSSPVIISEKVRAASPRAQRLMDEFYYAFKRRNGYAETEIRQKRDALEGVLVPYTEAQNRELLAEAGFVDIQAVLHWFPFVTWVAWAP